MRPDLTRKMDSSPWRRHDDIDAQNNIDAHGSTDVIAAIESMATAAINSIQAAGAAARSATELPQLTVNDGVDHIIDASKAAAIQFTARGVTAGSSSTDDADHEVTISIPANGTHRADQSSLWDGKIVS